MNKEKLISQLKNIIYSTGNKADNDNLYKLYLNLFNQVDFTNYKITIKNNPIKLMIKHKAFANKVYLYYNDNILYLENREVNLQNVNDLLPTFFIISLDKKENT